MLPDLSRTKHTILCPICSKEKVGLGGGVVIGVVFLKSSEARITSQMLRRLHLWFCRFGASLLWFFSVQNSTTWNCQQNYIDNNKLLVKIFNDLINLKYVHSLPSFPVCFVNSQYLLANLQITAEHCGENHSPSNDSYLQTRAQPCGNLRVSQQSFACFWLLSYFSVLSPHHSHQDTCISAFLSWCHLIFPSFHFHSLSFPVICKHLTPQLLTPNVQLSPKSTWVFHWLLTLHIFIIELVTLPPTLFLLLMHFLAWCHHYSPSPLTQEPESFSSFYPHYKIAKINTFHSLQFIIFSPFPMDSPSFKPSPSLLTLLQSPIWLFPLAPL